MLNHPVHIPRMDQDVFPSALIPFCEFGGSMSAMGVKIDQFTAEKLGPSQSTSG